MVVKSDDWKHFGDTQTENNKQLLLDHNWNTPTAFKLDCCFIKTSPHPECIILERLIDCYTSNVQISEL